MMDPSQADAYMNTQTPITFPHSLKITASWLDLFKATNHPCSFQLPLTADNPGMVSQRYLNTKIGPICLQQNKDDLAAGMLFLDLFSKKKKKYFSCKVICR